jgi:molybdate transport system regulatory protein
MTEARLSLRIDLPQGRIGPGKVALLEAIAEQGSISAAARRLGMSYRRAWMLVESLNQLAGTPVVSATTGGTGGGGASLTNIGRTIVEAYRAIERAAETAAQPYLDKITEGALPPRAPPAGTW